MKKVGFRNFRRFAEFPVLEFAPITFLVGENNAGKSSVVKGILAISDFINNQSRYSVDLDYDGDKSEKTYKEYIIEQLKNIKFYFNTNYLAHIGTFKRALYNKADDGVIEFYVGFGSVDIIFQIIEDKNSDNQVSGLVSKIIIKHYCDSFEATFDLHKNKAKVSFIKDIEKKSEDGITDEPKSVELEYKISDHFTYGYNIIEQLISTIKEEVKRIYEQKKEEKGGFRTLLKSLIPISSSILDGISGKFKSTHVNRSFSSVWRIKPWRYLNDIKYIYAHSVSQSVIYSAKDTNDYMSSTIHEFASIIEKGNEFRRDFIKKWMNEFNIGEDYYITTIGGEGHIVEIVSNGLKTLLSDKGMGSIKLMTLLFRLAINLYDKDKETKNKSCVFIIEEPEQNLHPNLQSKLADLFYELNRDYGYCFIIETHSEYIIRKTQVIVAENYSEDPDFEKKNPFKVYYFPSSGIPYDMKYTRSGMFEKKFGLGFMDEAGKLHMTVLKNSKK